MLVVLVSWLLHGTCIILIKKRDQCFMYRSHLFINMAGYIYMERKKMETAGFLNVFPFLLLLQVRGVGTGGIVSTAFCLLYKLFTLKLTRKQVMGLITHTDSPYIRALGFMYIR